ncbi:uncharacterized protein G2W53_012282 [Senna tora]|uniref:Uncharacterized protein n=1 Tax=Senna tora TaxID=362788 RepID=A0A834U3R7_9FABA|nr:uncharacterized protein G2W53_012282 [Senna tora]
MARWATPMLPVRCTRNMRHHHDWS